MSNRAMAKVAIAAMVMIMAACTASSSSTRQTIPPRFQGDWRGTFKGFVGKAPDAPEAVEWDDPMRLRLVSSPVGVRVYVGKNDTSLQEIDSNTIHTTWLDTNAVITLIRTGGSRGDVWVETWSVAVTVIGPNQMFTTFQHQVQNKGLQRVDDDAVWGMLAFGILKRKWRATSGYALEWSLKGFRERAARPLNADIRCHS